MQSWVLVTGSQMRSLGYWKLTPNDAIEHYWKIKCQVGVIKELIGFVSKKKNHEPNDEIVLGKMQ